MRTFAMMMLLALLAFGCKDEAPSKENSTTETTTETEEGHSADNGEWCHGHAIPESMCTKCHPELVAKFKEKGDWCAEHGFPESGCPECNPMTPPGEAKKEHSADNGEWCHGHAIPESMCTKCHPELVAKFKEKGDWCAEHGFPESGCPECNPMTPPGEEEHHGHGHGEGASAEDWCGGHDIPESMCTKCNPGLVAKFKEKGDWCAEHGFPESACPQCNPMKPPGDDDEPEANVIEGPFEKGTVIRLKDAEHERVAGIATTKVRSTPVGMGVRAPARVEFDPNRVAEVRAPFSGIVREVRVNLGDAVEKGDPLFVLESVEIGEIQAQIRSAAQEIETARSNYERQKRLQEQGVSPMRRVEDARQRLEEAQARHGSLRSSLRLAGAGSTGSGGRFTVRAPLNGTIVRRPAVMGASATESTPLARIADATRLWAIVDVNEREAHLVQIGQPVALTIDSLPGHTHEGKVSWVSPEVDERTRTVDVRAEIANPEGRLRANQFAEAEIGVVADRSSVVVPRDAVQRFEDASVVFVRKERGLYEPRAVRVVRRSGDLVQLSAGVSPGEEVVTTGGYLLRTELQRDAIGAGCCEVPEGG